MKRIAISFLLAILFVGSSVRAATEGSSYVALNPADTGAAGASDGNASSAITASGDDTSAQSRGAGDKNIAAPKADNKGDTGAKEEAPPAKPATAAEIPKPKGFDAAVKLYNQKKWGPAAAEFQKFIAAGVADLNTHAHLANCFYNMRQYSKAIKEFDWVSAHSQHSVSLGMSAEKSSRTLKSMMRGICPGDCLKASDPGWSHPPGRAADTLWKKFGSSQYFSARHIGDVIKLQNGHYKDMGKCPLCNGTGTVVVLHDGDPLPQ